MRWILALFSLFASVGANAAVVVNITAHRCDAVGTSTDCPAPLYVYFDLTATTATGITDTWRDLDYTCNFADAERGVWPYSGEDKNISHGPVAFHVFETPGTYLVSCAAVDRVGNGSSSTITITVDDPTLLTTYCVHPSGGSVSGCTGTELVSSSFGTAIATAYTAGARRIRFQGGQNYTGAPGTLSTGPVLVDAYGTGRVAVTTSGAWGTPSDKWVFKDIDFQVFVANNNLRVTDGDNNLWLNTSFIMDTSLPDDDSADFMSFGNGARNNAIIGGRPSDGVTFWGRSDITFNRLPCLWPPKYGSTVANTYMKGCSRLIREDFDDGYEADNVTPKPVVVAGLIFQHNRFTGRRAHNPIELRGVEAGPGSYLDKTLISYNWFGIDDFSRCYDCRGIAFFGDGNRATYSRIYRTLVENNVFADGTEIDIRNSQKATVIRNNLFEDHIVDQFYSRIYVSDQSSGGGGIATGEAASWAGDLQVYNNTFHLVGGTNIGAGIVLNGVWYACTNGPCIAKNNLVYSTTDPNLKAVTLVNGGGSSVASDNASRAGTDTWLLSSDPLVSAAPDPRVAANWELNAGAANLRGAPILSGAIRDYISRLRPTQASAVGAMDDGSGTQTPQPPAAPVLR